MGVVKVDIRPGNATTPRSQFLGLSLSRHPAFQAKVVATSSVSSPQGNVTQLQFAPNMFSPDSLGASGGVGTHYVEFVGGSSDGFISHIASTAPNTVVLRDLVEASGVFSVKIRPFWTVQDAFGANNEAGFWGELHRPWRM